MQRIAAFTACLVLLLLSSNNTHAASKSKPIESKVTVELSTSMVTPGATVTLNGQWTVGSRAAMGGGIY